MISVEEALGHIFALSKPLGTEVISLAEAAGRVLAVPAKARRDQPPFNASAMDGYALKGIESDLHAQFKVIGESAAGAGFQGRVGAGQCVRIFTGAPVPEGTDKVVIQENTSRSGDTITITDDPGQASHIRQQGADFSVGAEVSAPRVLRPADLALLAAMNVAEVTVSTRPQVAIIATGNELVMPGEEPGPDQIVASNSFGLKAMIEAEGGIARMLPIARDTEASLKQVFALAEGADLVLTIGGASVGDHDLVGQVAADLGMDQSFYKVAMRPGKPLMAGRMGNAAMIGLPGNPVSALVCGQVFVLPALRAMMGLGQAPAPRKTAPLASDLPANGPREHYMRARLTNEGLDAFGSQDSALLTVLSEARALIARPPHDPARNAGELVEYLPV
ncbi:MoeA-like domain-containing protein [Actibacterium atlanticum]|uniref:Molybdopterin molybdenumtransferase n=1 Tax=Actibacterium atlanticum TaxID=1461693 RepID=A0A058ZQ86_9RHOB|nr:gephyrin-like molybdotransferase Glp [Actibacterium atlanticum]KCV83415.1 MoeA-like domain-containing protein [Actibacterium atlanticum]